MTQRPLRWVGWGLAAAACVLVFAAYLQPEIIIDVGNRLISCF